MNPADSPRDPALERLLARRDIWQGRAAAGQGDGEPTGFPALDGCLAAGGWPRAALTELLAERAGIGELRLLMPALARLSQGARWIAWIDPPYVPHAAGLYASGVDLAHTLVVHPRRGAERAGERLWALEQALASGTCSAVLAWPGALAPKAMRRLQLAAERGGSLGFLFRRISGAAGRGEGGKGIAASPSNAALRLVLRPHHGGLRIDALRQRGGRPESDIHLPATELCAPGARHAPDALPVGAESKEDNHERSAGSESSCQPRSGEARGCAQ